MAKAPWIELGLSKSKYYSIRRQQGFGRPLMLRYSGRKYENTKERLQEIKEKYKNGVTEEILQEFIKGGI
jgi:hypothetical protein